MSNFFKFFKYGNYGWLGEYRANAIKSLCEQAFKSSGNYQNITIYDIDSLNPQIPLDVFHACYLLNTIHEAQDELLQRITEPILVDEELRNFTIADDLISRFFSVKYVLAILEELKEQEQQEQDEQKRQAIQQLIQQMQTNQQIQQSGQQAQQSQTQQQVGDQVKQQMEQIMQEVTKEAKKQAREEAEKAKLYTGLKAGVGHDVSFGELLDLDFIVDIRQLLRMFRDLDLNLTKTKKSSIFGIYDDIKFGNDLTRVMPQSYALPDELFWYYYATSQLPEIDTKTEKISEYTLVVDKSGSMDSRNKTMWSRAVALVLAKQAKKKRVKAKLMFFDDTPFSIIDLQNEFNKALDHILKLRCSGGTSIDRALKKADIEGIGTIILITDGEDEVTYKTDKRLISVMVDGHNEDLQKISERYLKVKLDKEGVISIFE